MTRIAVKFDKTSLRFFEAKNQGFPYILLQKSGVQLDNLAEHFQRIVELDSVVEQGGKEFAQEGKRKALREPTVTGAARYSV